MFKNDQLYKAWLAGGVKRWHTIKSPTEQTTGEHTFGVVLLAAMLYPDATPELFRACLVHDLGEKLSGDIPAHAKWFAPELGQHGDAVEAAWMVQQGMENWAITPEEYPDEYYRLKTCDIFELLMYAKFQVQVLGNQEFNGVFSRACTYAQNFLQKQAAEGLEDEATLKRLISFFRSITEALYISPEDGEPSYK